MTKGDSNRKSTANRKSTSNRNNLKGDSKSQSSNFCYGNLYGFPCCKKTVNNPEYDKNGYAYGTENGKSCVRNLALNIDRSKRMQILCSME